jgi:hypothetical protein
MITPSPRALTATDGASASSATANGGAAGLQAVLPAGSVAASITVFLPMVRDHTASTSFVP